MEKVARVFKSFEEADAGPMREAMRRYVAAQRLEIVMELRNLRHPDCN